MDRYDPGNPEHRAAMARAMANDVLWRWVTVGDNDREMLAHLQHIFAEGRRLADETQRMLGGTTDDV